MEKQIKRFLGWWKQPAIISRMLKQMLAKSLIGKPERTLNQMPAGRLAWRRSMLENSLKITLREMLAQRLLLMGMRR